jgi:hypothetical protein
MAASSCVDCVPWGFGDKPIAPASPWQNGFAERLIGSIHRECLDQIVVFREAHLLQILRPTRAITTWSAGTDHAVEARCWSCIASAAGWINVPNQSGTSERIDPWINTRRSLARFSGLGSITLFPILGGLHHHYARV